MVAPDQVRELAPGVGLAVIDSIADAVNHGFMWIVPIALLGIVVTVTMKAPPPRDAAPRATPDASHSTTDH